MSRRGVDPGGGVRGGDDRRIGRRRTGGGRHAAGVSFEVDGETIPLVGFAQMTVLGAVLGGVVPALVRHAHE